MDSIKKKFDWLLSSHYKMERFGVTFGILVCLMVILMSTIYARKVSIQKQAMGNIVQYTTSFKSSLAQSEGQVVNVFCNDTHTECFVLLKYNNMDTVVTDASQYHLFITGSNLDQRKEDLQSVPSATLYMFGMSGYMGIYLVDMNGFPSQILDIVVRCNKLTGPMPSDIPTYADKSFNNYDQFRFYINPGASDYTPANFLNMGRMTVSEIYDAMVVKYQEEELRNALTQSLDDMEAQLSLIDEYVSRVEAAGIVVPPAPMQIRGDSITTTEEGRKVLVTDYLVQGGYNFDWYHGSVKQGYISSVLAGVDGETSILHYIAAQRKLAEGERLNVNTGDWLRSDGTSFEVQSTTVESEATKNIQKNIQALKDAWSTYFKLKVTYQTKQMEDLLILEQNLFDTSVNYTVNASNVRTLW